MLPGTFLLQLGRCFHLGPGTHKRRAGDPLDLSAVSSKAKQFVLVARIPSAAILETAAFRVACGDMVKIIFHHSGVPLSGHII